MDTAPAGVADRVKAAVEAVPGVVNCHKVRARVAGPYLFVDVHVVMDGRQSLAHAHALTEVIEDRIAQIVPRADVTVHHEPQSVPDELPTEAGI